ncbi:MAG: S9 family peptidase [Pedosphaera sp.]|nr:S9 family peptidase [Pedosphaera sp.]
MSQVLCIIAVLILKPNSRAAVPVPPVTKIVPHRTQLHGKERVDDFHWLRGATNKAVLKHLTLENVYTDAMMRHTDKLQATLYKEMVARIKETDATVPFRMGGWLYYSRTVKGQQYPIYCRKRPEPGAKESVTLDLNLLGKGKPYIALGTSDVSDDGHWIAYALDFTGFRQYTLFIKDLRTGKVHADRIEKVGTATWSADNRTLFYTVEDEAKRQYRLYRHETGAKIDKLIFEEKDELFDLNVSRTRSEDFLLCSSTSKTTSEVRYLRANDPAGQWQLIAARAAEHEYFIDHHGDSFYIRSNKGGRNFELLSVPVANPAQNNWKVVIPHRPAVMLADMDFFKRHHVLMERENGLPHLRVTEMATGKSRRMEISEPVYDLAPDTNAEFDTATFRYSYESLTTPDSTFEYDLNGHKSTLLKRQEVLGKFKPTDYTTERLHATASDGTKIPISIVYRNGIKRDGTAPLVLDGYGAYGIPNDVSFSSSRLSLLDRGVIFAIAHIRGGGEIGKPWHDAGRMMNKKNSFTDFITSAEHLITERFTSRDKLIITGGSAGGLLMGAVLNARPDLCHAAILHVPFVDLINTMLDETLPLTVTEFEEWGNPKKKAEYDYLVTYCPYSNLRVAAYPAMLVKTSLHDSQVMYWEPAKYVAKLRTLKTDTRPLLFKINLAAGHGGSSGRYDHLKETAFDHAFILTQTGLVK